MKALFMILLLTPVFLNAQPDYHYDQVDEISTENPVAKIMWVKKSQLIQSFTFDHMMFFVRQSGDDEIVGHTVMLSIYHNRQLVHTKECRAQENLPNSVYVYEPIKLKAGDSLYLVLTLLPKPDSRPVAYLLNIRDRVSFLRKNPDEYRRLLVEEVDAGRTASAAEKVVKPGTTGSGYSVGMFGERYPVKAGSKPSKHKALKETQRQELIMGIIGVLGFLTGF